MFSVKIQKCLLALFCLRTLLGTAQSPPIWIDVPFVRQERNGCGAASIAMVMQYWRRQQGRPAEQEADASQIQGLLYSRNAHGIYASDLERYLGQHEFRTFAFPGQWSDLLQHLAQGRPLIVALKQPSGQDRHYVVVAGVDEARKLVMVNDPAERKLLERAWSEFEREWKGAGKWTLLAIPRDHAPPVR